MVTKRIKSSRYKLAYLNGDEHARSYGNNLEKGIPVNTVVHIVIKLH
jgi:hypothetical protein